MLMAFIRPWKQAHTLELQLDGPSATSTAYTPPWPTYPQLAQLPRGPLRAKTSINRIQFLSLPQPP
jgi:hypothetical protein